MNTLSAHDHYQRLLGSYYSWSVGDLNKETNSFKEWLESLRDKQTQVSALDLGCGQGAYALLLADMGYQVRAIDFCDCLLGELDEKASGQAIQTIQGDLRDKSQWGSTPHDLVLCWGDTLTHLESHEDVSQLLSDISDSLRPGGLFLVSFRNYVGHQDGEQFSIPVKLTDELLHTCIITYKDQQVKVHDIFHEKLGEQWSMKESSYHKLVLHSHEVMASACLNGLRIAYQSDSGPVITLAFEKTSE